MSKLFTYIFAGIIGGMIVLIGQVILTKPLNAPDSNSFESKTVKFHNESPSSDSMNSSSPLLPCVQTLVRLEQSLTATLEATSPLLSLPTPTSLSQAECIQTLARSARIYSTHTHWRCWDWIHHFRWLILPHQVHTHTSWGEEPSVRCS